MTWDLGAINRSGLQVLAYFTHLKFQKCIGDYVGDLKYVFLGENDPPDTFYPTYYARI
jgi:hypothetical protein